MTTNNVPQPARQGQPHAGPLVSPNESPLDEIHFLQSVLIPHLEHLLATTRRRFAALSLIQEAKDNARAGGVK